MFLYGVSYLCALCSLSMMFQKYFSNCDGSMQTSRQYLKLVGVGDQGKGAVKDTSVMIPKIYIP